MRILVADKFESSGLEALRAQKHEVLYQPGTRDEALVRAVRESLPDVLVVRSTRVAEAVLAEGALKLVVRAGAGYNTIDVAAASRRGIYVSNCPGKNSIAVAELAFGLILSLDRRIPDNVASLRAGAWNKEEFSRARGLHGRTLGLIGVGKIGSEMVPRALAFGLRVIAWSRSLTDEKAEQLGIEWRSTPIDVAREADIVSVHLALAPDTKRLLGAEFFGALRDGALFVNTARAEIVEPEALAAAVRDKKLRVGSDVFEKEPAGGTGAFDDPIAKEPGVYGTHHVGASTEQAQEAIAAETVRIIRTFHETGIVPNAVNLAKRTPATHRLLVRHLDRPGVLASVLGALRAADINVQEMQNVVFEGAVAAVADIHLDRAPPAGLLDRCREENADIIELSLVAL